MFSSFFTTHADSGKGKTRTKGPNRRSRGEAIVTWGLVLVWVFLMGFGVVCWLNPKWLQALSRSGIQVEARDYKHFGDDALRGGRYPFAIAQYLQALKIDPDQVRVLVNLGIAYSNAGHRTKGSKILKDALQMDPSDSLKGVIYYNLGEVLEAQGERDEAIRSYRQAGQFYGEKDKVYRKLALLHLAGKEYGEAREAFEMALAAQLDPSLPYQYMLYRSTDMYEDEATHLSIIEEQLAHGIGTEDLARYDVEIISQLHESDVEIAKTHNHLGLICARMRDASEAMRHFQRSLEIWPGNADAKRNLQLLQRLQQDKGG